jgi:hypothetical protein
VYIYIIIIYRYIYMYIYEVYVYSIYIYRVYIYSLYIYCIYNITLAKLDYTWVKDWLSFIGGFVIHQNWGGTWRSLDGPHVRSLTESVSSTK